MNKITLFIISFLFVVLSNVKADDGNVGASGKIVGKVVDQANSETLIGLAVVVQGTAVAAPTNIEGRYELKLAPGKYTIVFKYIGYNTKTISEVEVKQGQVTELNVGLEDAAVQTKEVVISATYKQESISALYSIQKNNVAMSSGISSDLIKRSPDRNTSDVLKRVSGASIQDNKFVIIRGLADRYNAATLNNAPLPSSEPDRKAFSFDIIPANMIDNIVINKTASPDLPGDFAGGVIQIFTKDVPDQNFINIGIGSGYHSISTFKKFISNERGKNEFIGFNNESKLPASFPKTPQEYRGAEIDQQVAQSKTLGNPYKEVIGTALPTQNYQLTVGNNIKIGKGSFGSIVALNYRNSYTLTEVNRTEFDDAGTTVFNYNDKQYKYNTTLGGIANFAYVSGKNKIALKNLYNRNLDNVYTDRTGKSEGGSNIGVVQLNASELTQRGILNSQLEGDHRLTEGGVKLAWNLNYTNQERSQPDLRTISYNRAIDTVNGDVSDNYFRIVGDNSRRFFSNLTETGYGGQAAVSVPFAVKGIKNTLKVGYLTQEKKRDFKARAFAYREPSVFRNPLNVDSLIRLDKDVIFSDSNISKNAFYLDEQTINSDAYKANAEQQAAFIMLDNKLTQRLRIVFGARVELYNQGINAIDASSLPIATRDKQEDILPSANITFQLNEKSNLRAAAYKTVSRAEFRELAPFEFYDYVTTNLLKGNPDLKRGQNTNFDLRYEWYPSSSEAITVTGFYKKFKNPIEQVLNSNSAVDRKQIEYTNANSADIKGLELELRKKLDFIADVKFFKNIVAFTNMSVILSEVELGTGRANRSLQGQSPYLINAGLQYYNAVNGFSVNALYNKIGERIAFVGFQGYADIYERGRDIVDLQVSKKFLKEQLEFKINISDILAQSEIFYQNTTNDKEFKEGKDRVLRSIETGSTIGVALTYNIGLAKKK